MKLGKFVVFGAPVVVIAALGVFLWMKPAVPPASSTELAEIAIAYMKDNKPELAQETFRHALDQEPKNHRALYGAGQLAFKQNRLHDAEAFLRAAYEAKPTDVDTILTLGAVYHKGGAYKQAQSLYEAVRKVQPGNASVVYNLGMLEINLKDYPKSKAYFEEYLRMVPNAPDKERVRLRISKLDVRIKEQTSK